jgi:signal transduction histidine kinase
MSNQLPADALGRVLLKTATARDAAIAQSVLDRAGIPAVVCPDLACVDTEMRQGVGALLLAEEVLGDTAMLDVMEQLRQQEPWSDLPVLVLARPGADSGIIREAMERIANVTVIERPLRIAALVSTVRSALRARQRQYDMRRLLESLREDDQRKTEFLATLAHELRNPLAPLNTALALLRRADLPEEEVHSHYDMMGRQVEHMVRLIDDLMEVSRITRGRIALRLEPLSLRAVLSEAIELARPQMSAADHRFELRMEPGDWPLMGDGVRLNQVFANLLNNAAKYTPRGGVIRVDVERHGESACVHVADNGVGVPEEMLPRIFDMFVQVNSASRAAQGGLGIGLTLVRSLVEMHGGRVSAKSGGEGRGTEMIVELPLTPGLATAAVIADGLPVVPDTPLLGPILVVDDNEDAANTLAMYLDVVGAITDVAYDGPKALAAVERIRPQVAILDIGMPGMDGCELAQRLRADPANAGMLLIALSGWGQPDDRDRVSAAGFDHHLLKPPDISKLTALLQKR